MCVHLNANEFLYVQHMAANKTAQGGVDVLQYNSFCCCRQQQTHLQGCLITGDCDCNAAGGDGGDGCDGVAANCCCCFCFCFCCS